MLDSTAHQFYISPHDELPTNYLVSEMTNTGTMRNALKITKALSDEQRVRIVMMLRSGELCVCQIVEVLGLAPSTVSKHLSILSDVDLILLRKDGRWAYYRLAEPETHPLLHWLEQSLKKDATIRQDQKTLKSVTACTPQSLSQRQRNEKETA